MRYPSIHHKKETPMLRNIPSRSRAPRWLATLSLAATAGVAQADVITVPDFLVTLVYSGPGAGAPNSVPTLSTWALLILASVLGLMAVRSKRLGGSERHWAVMLGLAFVLAAGSGGLVVNQAMAATANFSNPSGGSVPVACMLDNASSQFLPTTSTNTTAVTLTIVSVTPSPEGLTWSGTCQPGLQLAPGATCEVTIFCTTGPA